MHIALFFNMQKQLPRTRTVNLLAGLAAVLFFTGWEAGLLRMMLNLLRWAQR